MLTISWVDNPGMEGNYKYFYNLKLTGPNIYKILTCNEITFRFS